MYMKNILFKIIFSLLCYSVAPIFKKENLADCTDVTLTQIHANVYINDWNSKVQRPKYSEIFSVQEYRTFVV